MKEDGLTPAEFNIDGMFTVTFRIPFDFDKWANKWGEKPFLKRQIIQFINDFCPIYTNYLRHFYISILNSPDTENIPLKEDIHTYFLREVKPHVNEAWINLDATKIGYEISFNKYFYKHKPLRTINENTTDIIELEKLSDGLIAEILNLV